MNQLLEKYHTLDHHYDELSQDNKQVRQHWQHFLDSLDTIGDKELQQRLFEARRQILDNGVSYNVYDDRQGIDRPWELDPIPYSYRQQGVGGDRGCADSAGGTAESRSEGYLRPA